MLGIYIYASAQLLHFRPVLHAVSRPQDVAWEPAGASSLDWTVCLLSAPAWAADLGTCALRHEMAAGQSCSIAVRMPWQAYFYHIALRNPKERQFLAGTHGTAAISDTF